MIAKDMRKIKDSSKVYHSRKAVSRSDLFLLSKSPQYFKYIQENGRAETDALRFGTMVHTFVLEPNLFKRRYIVIPNIDRRTREGKAILEEVSRIKKEIVTESELSTITAMRDAVLNNKYAYALLQGVKEMSYYWTDELTGIKLKCRPDCVSNIGQTNVIVDLKSCENAQTDAFMRDALKYGYDLQAATYKTGVELIEGTPHKFVFIAVEKKPPYGVNILEVDEPALRKGTDDFRNYLGMLKYCRDTDNWYSYTGETGRPNVLSLPAWLIKEYE